MNCAGKWQCVLTVVGVWLGCVAGHCVAEQPQGDAGLPAAATGPIDFVRDVAPIFQKTCISCHGPEANEGGLRLDDRQRGLQGGDGGRAIVPGKSGESRLIHLVAGLDKETGRMPPDGEGTPLTVEQIGVLRGWIDQGAPWPESVRTAASKHGLWSLRSIADSSPPAVRDAGWVISPVDAFILAKMEEQQLVPSVPADRATLVRRLHLDLLGLPPTPAEVAEFLADESPGAYERLVDRLLSSPRFGERWGRHWLDLARYADSDGYEKDRPRPFAWRYREWVLAAVNADLPYDQFTLAQLAGDLLPATSSEARIEHRVASGFHRNTLHNTEGGADQEEDRVKKTIDRTNTFGTTWLGLTVGCAQCHSHKYDPFTQREYYQLFAFFNNLEEQDIDAPLLIEQQRYSERKAVYDQSHEPFLAALQKYENEQLAQAQQEWEPTAAKDSLVWTALSPTSARSRHGAELTVQPDQSLLATGTNRVSDVYVVEAAASQPSIRAVRLEVLPDKSLDKQGPGRADNGNFVLSSLIVETVSNGTATRIGLRNPRADFSQQSCDVAQAINDNVEDFWAVSPQIGKRHVATFEFDQPITLAAGATLRITLDQQYNQPNKPHNLGRFRLAVTDGQGPITLEGLSESVAAALAVPLAERTVEQAKVVTTYFRSLDPELLRLERAVAEHARQAPQPPETKSQAVAQRESPRVTNILVRGDFLNPGEPVEPASPALLPPLTPRGERADRLDLANWVVSDDNPLPARVAVNRVWERFFGRGLVVSVDDFGKQGSPPSHPELLDWLASSFRRHDWSVKHLVRDIVLSAAYRQSSAVRTELVGIDPENVWLARQQRLRLEAEIIRDAALAVSGLMDSRIGGPSVRPPQPSEHANLTYSNSAKWAESSGGDRYRRGLYTFFQRTSPYPMLVTFDAPDSNECCARRESSNTPLQALTLWNDPAFFECAQALGRRIVEDIPPSAELADTIEQRAAFAVQLAMGRMPTGHEVQELVSLYEGQLELARREPAMAQQLCGRIEGRSTAELAELSAWILVGRTILNLDEFIVRE